jgi:acyl-CoA synthetase (AMP-forming)/AMP-acid ligase II
MSHANLLNSAYLSTVTPGNPDGLRRVCNPIPVFHIFGLSTGILIPLLFSSRYSNIYFPFLLRFD